ncbi:MAG TPA: Hsp20/alpha crystallin family protein [Planctomycetota bacterium]|nr:Hsp20/alpha crystallin family protein [Planctomycetota bacterium]
MALWNLAWDWDPWATLRTAARTQAFPPVNVYESGEAYGIEAEVPGVAPEDLELTVEGNVVTIAGQRRPDEVRGAFHRRERLAGRFARSLRFPVQLDSSHVEAQCVDGMLTARIAKAPEARARRIAVKSV